MLSLAFFLSISPLTVLAALYVTSPTNKTVFRPGAAHPSIIKWIDDESEPPANQLGKLKIQLMLADTVVSTLGTGIPSSHREFEAHIPQAVGPDSSDYAIVFIPSPPFLPVYSARFTIANHTTDRSSGEGTLRATSSMSLSGSRATVAAGSARTTTSSAANPTSTFDPRAEKIGTTESSSCRMQTTARSVRFKVLYVLWPALVGAVLAS